VYVPIVKRLTVVFALGLAVATIGVGSAPVGAASGPVVGPAHTVATSQARDSNLNPNGIGSAFDGTNFFVVWTDSRGGTKSPDIYGARVAPDGTVLDPGGIPIAVNSGAQNQPTVAFNGTDFVVAWADHGGFVKNRVKATRVSPQGVKLDTPPLVLGGGGGPEIAVGGSTALVVWSSAGIKGGRVASDGTVLDPGGFTVASDSGENAFGAASVASNGTDFLVGYNTGTDGNHLVAVTKVTSGGVVGSSVGVAANADDPSVASNGTDYLVAYAACQGDCEFVSNTDIDTRMVAPDLALSPAVTAASGSPAQDEPHVAFDSGRFLVAYRRQALDHMVRTGPIDIRSSLLNRTGNSVTAQGVIVDSDVYGTNSVTAGPGDDFGVAYQDLPASASPLLLRTVSPK
jgi:hypothetical protein